MFLVIHDYEMEVRGTVLFSVADLGEFRSERFKAMAIQCLISMPDDKDGCCDGLYVCPGAVAVVTGGI